MLRRTLSLVPGTQRPAAVSDLSRISLGPVPEAVYTREYPDSAPVFYSRAGRKNTCRAIASEVTGTSNHCSRSRAFGIVLSEITITHF